MKKIVTHVMALTILFLTCLFTGCIIIEVDYKEPEEMVFRGVGTDGVIKRLTINENLEFAVEFEHIPPSEQAKWEGIGVYPGANVSGKIKDTTNWWKDKVINGNAKDMRSNSTFIQGVFTAMQLSLEFKMEYDVAGNPNEAEISFPEAIDFGNPNQMLAETSTVLMGGVFDRVR